MSTPASMTVKQLKAALTLRKLPTDGLKKALKLRLENAITASASSASTSTATRAIVPTSPPSRGGPGSAKKKSATKKGRKKGGKSSDSDDEDGKADDSDGRLPASSSSDSDSKEDVPAAAAGKAGSNPGTDLDGELRRKSLDVPAALLQLSLRRRRHFLTHCLVYLLFVVFYLGGVYYFLLPRVQQSFVQRETVKALVEKCKSADTNDAKPHSFHEVWDGVACVKEQWCKRNLNGTR